MLYKIGRFLQVAGLIILPQAIVLELLDKVTLGKSLVIAAAGAIVFLLGVSLQKGGGQ